MSQVKNTKRNTILFWLSTGLFSAFMLSSTIPNIMGTPEWVEIFNQLGYPLYMLPFIGVAKLLGIIALLVPGFPRIKEWAYAGLFFDLTGASYSAIMVSGFDPLMLVMLFPYVTGTVSYIYHHKRLNNN
ncbi:MAG: DoxX family protein [Cyclobacteriaceae bacterium]|nr:DoxX family protein [Cyclobacteriaceae bacterium]